MLNLALRNGNFLPFVSSPLFQTGVPGLTLECLTHFPAWFKGEEREGQHLCVFCFFVLPEQQTLLPFVMRQYVGIVSTASGYEPTDALLRNGRQNKMESIFLPLSSHQRGNRLVLDSIVIKSSVYKAEHSAELPFQLTKYYLRSFPFGEIYNFNMICYCFK